MKFYCNSNTPFWIGKLGSIKLPHSLSILDHNTYKKEWYVFSNEKQFNYYKLYNVLEKMKTIDLKRKSN